MEPMYDRHHVVVDVDAVHERPVLVCTCGWECTPPSFATPEELWMTEQHHRIAAYAAEHDITPKEHHGPEHVA
jgi:hypothetical protein